MKKILFPICAAALLLGGLGALKSQPANVVRAEGQVNGLVEGDDTPDFYDNFEDYSDYEDLGVKNWTNGYFAKTGDNNETCCSPGQTVEGEYKTRFAVVDAPEDVENHGKVLYYNTAAMYDSFTYLTIKGLMVKDFEVTYDVYHAKEQDYATNWLALQCRKPVDGRYNGVSNILLTQAWGGSMSCAFVPYRSVDESFGALPDKNVTKNDIFDCSSGWVTMKVTCITSYDDAGKASTTLTMYGNDVLMGSCVVPQASSQVYGLISFCSCVSINYIDNIHVKNLDTEPYVPEETETADPVFSQEQYDYVRGEDLHVGVDLKDKAIVSLKQATKLLAVDTDYTVGTNEIVIKDSFLSTLKSGNKTFILVTEGGQSTCVVKVPEATEPETSEPEGEGEQEPTEKKGCGGSILATAGITTLISLFGIGFAMNKRKEK